jgi:hypothetical protein
MFLQKPLAVWNLCLSVFSGFGLYYTSMELISTFVADGYYGVYCRNNQLYRGYTGYWTWMFTVSKVKLLKIRFNKLVDLFADIRVRRFLVFGAAQTASYIHSLLPSLGDTTLLLVVLPVHARLPSYRYGV